MALIAHWPLNGNTNDISGNGYHGTPTNITYGNGKIGQAASFDNTSRYVTIQNGDIFNLKSQVSLSAWIKMPAYISTQYPTIIAKGSTFGGTQSYSLAVTNTGILYFEFLNEASTRRNIGYSLSDNYAIDTWLHVVGTNDNGIINLYVNGIKVANSNFPNELMLTTSSDILISDSNGSRYFNGLINDVRIYDHALTDMEIQEIARAKVLHYTFDDMQEPTTNLIINPLFDSTSNWSLSTNGGGSFSVADGYGKITKGTAGSYNFLAQNLTKSNTNKTLTLSAKFKNNVIGNCALRLVIFDGGSVPAQPMLTISLDGSGGTILGSVTASYSGTATAYRLDILSGSYYSGLSDIDIEFTEIQLEEKPYATEFTIGSRTGKVNDYSGFFNHSDPLTETTTPRWTADAKIGTGSYNFNGSTYLTTNSFPSIPEFSVSLWFYSTAVENYRNVFHTHFQEGSLINTGVRLEQNTAGELKLGVSADNVWRGVNILTGMQPNKWYHVVAVGNPTTNNLKVYVDSVKTVDIPHTSWPTDFPSLNIGRGYDTSVERWFKGYIDDVRIYATALSDKDIKDLYESRAEIEQSGVLYARDLLSNAEETVNLVVLDFQNFAIGQSQDFTYHRITKLDDNKYEILATTDIPGKIQVGFSNPITWYDGQPVTISAYIHEDYYAPGSTTQWGLSRESYGGIHLKDIGYQTYTYIGAWGGATQTGAVGFRTDWLDGVVVKAGSKLIFSNYQAERKSYSTPFVSTYRPAIQLPSTLDFAGNEVHETGTANFEDFSTVGITNGLVGYWQLNNDVKDYSGNNSHGTIYGGITYKGDYHTFDGEDNSYVDMGNTTALAALGGTSNITVMAMVRYSAYDGGTETYSVITYKGTPWTWLVENPGSTLRFRITAGGVDTTIADIATHPLNEWLLVVGTYDGTNMKIYINGIEKNSKAQTGTLGITTAPMRLGTYAANAYMFHGDMKYVKIFNRALTAEEIAIEYNTMVKNEVQVSESGTLYAKDLKQY